MIEKWEEKARTLSFSEIKPGFGGEERGKLL